MTSSEFRALSQFSVTLLGMSGIGKTHLSQLLPKDKWFHYSGDYRIGTRYLDESILDSVKAEAMKNPVLRNLLCSDSIYIRNNITFTHLQPISNFLGKLGNPEKGGLSVEEFKRRQRLFRMAEMKAMRDVGDFIEKARAIYGYPHFLNDAGGSICGLGHDECWQSLSQQTLILYLRADDSLEGTLIERARVSPKPLYYEETFLDSNLDEFMETNNIRSADEIDPDQFVQWVFPRLITYRRSQYENLAERYGYVVDAARLRDLDGEDDFFDLIHEAVANG